MPKRLFIAIIFSCCCLACPRATPPPTLSIEETWWQWAARQYPASEYLVGIGSGADSRSAAREQAMIEIVSQIQAKISSEILIVKESFSGSAIKEGERIRALQQSQIKVTAQLEHAEFIKIVKETRAAEMHYALAVLAKSDFLMIASNSIKTYREKFQGLSRNIEERIAAGEFSECLLLSQEAIGVAADYTAEMLMAKALGASQLILESLDMQAVGYQQTCQRLQRQQEWNFSIMNNSVNPENERIIRAVAAKSLEALGITIKPYPLASSASDTSTILAGIKNAYSNPTPALFFIIVITQDCIRDELYFCRTALQLIGFDAAQGRIRFEQHIDDTNSKAGAMAPERASQASVQKRCDELDAAIRQIFRP